MFRLGRLRIWLGLHVALAASVAAGLTVTAQETERFFYWVYPDPALHPITGESFVIEVDGEHAAQIDAIRNGGGIPGFSGLITAEAASYNKNYSAPGQPVWNWQVDAVQTIFDFRTTVFPFCECPPLIANPSDIAADPVQWIQRNGNGYGPIRYAIQRRVDPSKRDAMANVSNRGMTGAGEKTLITGLIITGGEPRNVVVRALGPSLSAAGVQQAAANPKIEVYRGSTRVASNADWQSDARADVLRNSYPALAPTNEREAAMFLTLLPGAYTLHGINEAGTEGVVLLEAYDVDSGNP